MSWGGPAPAPFQLQQPSYGNGPPAYSQPPFNGYGYQAQNPNFGQQPYGPQWSATGPSQRPQENRPPKKKGNPIITRYPPPPPGYRGPSQPQIPFVATTSFHPTHPAHGFGPSPQGLQSHGFPNGSNVPPMPAQNYGSSQVPTWPRPSLQAQNYSWSQSGHHAHQPSSQPPYHPNGQARIHSGAFPGFSQSHPPYNPNLQDHGQPHSPIGPPQNVPTPHRAHLRADSSSLPQFQTQHVPDVHVTPTQATVNLATSQNSASQSQSMSAVDESQFSGKPQLFLAWDDWDFDFDGAIWPKSNEPVDPNLSLGVIIWHPAKQVTRALPSTFMDAEEQALKPIPEGLENGDSVSMYFTAENSHEAFLDVRQTDDWELLQDDPVFVVFTDKDMERDLVTIEDCIAQRDRPDVDQTITEADEDHEMHDATPDIMDHLEQELSGGREGISTISKKLEPVDRTQMSQEDILAKLGVTGAPKPPTGEPIMPFYPVYNDKTVQSRLSPVPLIKPPLPPSSLPRAPAPSGLHHSTPSPTNSQNRKPGTAASLVKPPLPPLPPASDYHRYNPWNAPQHSPALSDGSNHTMAGSDFESEKPSEQYEHASSTTTPSLQRSDSSFSRKRSYENAAHAGESVELQDDYAKRKRRSQVDAAYSRR